MKECRIIIINEESNELLKNELIEDDLADQIAGIVEDGFIENYEECEQVCSQVTKMLDEVGISTEDHDEMIDALGDLKLVRKDIKHEYIEKLKKIKKTKGKIIKIKRKLKRTKDECACG